MKPWLGSNTAGLAIVRVSSRRQDGNISHETQEAEIRAYCERNGITLKEVFRIVESAWDADERKKYTKAINFALANDIRHVCFYMHDREARNLTDTERHEKLILAGLVVIHYVRDQKVVHKDSPGADFLMRDFQAVTNKHYSRALSTRVGDAMKQKAESGWFPSNHVPLGYIVKRARDENGRELRRGSIVVKDPVEKNVQWVRREFELRAQGYSFEQIRRAVIAEGFVPTTKLQSYRKAAIEARISNPFYEGRFRWQGMEYIGKHELIIPTHILDKAKRMKWGTRTLKLLTQNTGVFGGGWMKCGECGCAILYDPKKKVAKQTGRVTVFHYYHCSNGRRFHDSMAGRNVNEAEIWAQFDRVVEAITLPESLARDISRALNDSQRFVVGQAMERISHARKTIRALEEQEERLYDDMIKGVIEPDLFKRMINKARGERTRLSSEIDQNQANLRGNARETESSIIELCKSARSLYEMRSPSEKRDFLEKVLSNPRLLERTVEYDLRKPFNVLVKMKRNEEWRAQIDNLRTECAALSGGDFLERPRRRRLD